MNCGRESKALADNPFTYDIIINDACRHQCEINAIALGQSMAITPFHALTCPLDGNPLFQQDTVWHCSAGHSFDIARQGYTHLLPAHQKRSIDPGDSKTMVAARQRFLNKGYYQTIARALNDTVLDTLPTSGTASCLDAGCGEGYYLRQLAAACGQQQTLALLGLDISKWAVLAAAKQETRINWIVGNNANLPVHSGTLDNLLCVFGFPNYAEFARVLKPGGQLLQVDAGPDHLRTLRGVIYPTLNRKSPTNPIAPKGFTISHVTTITFPLTLVRQEDIADLLVMTPHFYRTTPEGRAKASALQSLTDTVDVRVSHFRRQ